MSTLITLNCATCRVDTEANDTRIHNDEVECGTCRSKRHRTDREAYEASLAEENRRAEARVTRHQQRVGAMQPGGLARRQAGS